MSICFFQIAHPPKYADTRQEHVFRDYSQSNAPPLPEAFTFLYNKPQPSGGEKGGKGERKGKDGRIVERSCKHIERDIRDIKEGEEEGGEEERDRC